MKIEIEIPKEFEKHFNQDRFEDSLQRLSADANLLAGNYEQEMAMMLIGAFKDAKIKEQEKSEDLCKGIDEEIERE